MCCVDEEIIIRRKLARLPGVERYEFNLVSQKLAVDHSCPKEDIVNALHVAGFKASTEQSKEQELPFWSKHSALLFTVLSGLLAAIGITLDALETSTKITTPILSAAILLGGWKVAIRAFYALKNRVPDMNLLMTVAMIGAMIIGEWAEASSVVFLFSLALMLESLSMDRARRSIHQLLDLSPRKATVRRNGSLESVPVEEIKIEDTIIVRPGERLPLDGLVIDGESSVDEATITGESIPQSKCIGSTVFGGTLNRTGYFEYQVTRLAPDSLIARITALVEEAQSHKAPSQTFVERFSRIYTPAVIVLAALVAIVPPVMFGGAFVDWFYRSLVLLVIACPCALVISTPVTIVSALTNAARNGVLVKGGLHLENIGKVKAIAFDKTGTLTRGVPYVVDVIPLDSISPDELIQMAASIESKSEHRISSAIVRAAAERGCTVSSNSVDEFLAIPGKGIAARMNGRKYFLGNQELMEEYGISTEQVSDHIQKIQSEGKIVVLISSNETMIGIISVGDKARPETTSVLKSLHSMGVRKLVMLTGDSKRTAAAIAAQIGIDEVHAAHLPEDKVERIRTLSAKNDRIAMVGDGINDAPALAAADVGIAMGIAGTDAALESSDVVLMSDNLVKLPFLISLSRRTNSIIKQNITLALATKLVFLALAFTGHATLWMAVLADDGASLAVILNGLRALRNGGGSS